MLIRTLDADFNTAVLEGFDKLGILVVFNAGVKIKPQHSLSIRGFYFCDKAEDGQKNSFAKPSFNEMHDKGVSGGIRIPASSRVKIILSGEFALISRIIPAN
jgi:hypothetical protein